MFLRVPENLVSHRPKFFLIFLETMIRGIARKINVLLLLNILEQKENQQLHIEANSSVDNSV